MGKLLKIADRGGDFNIYSAGTAAEQVIDRYSSVNLPAAVFLPAVNYLHEETTCLSITFFSCLCTSALSSPRRFFTNTI